MIGGGINLGFYGFFFNFVCLFLLWEMLLYFQWSITKFKFLKFRCGKFKQRKLLYTNFICLEDHPDLLKVNFITSTRFDNLFQTKISRFIMTLKILFSRIILFYQFFIHIDSFTTKVRQIWLFPYVHQLAKAPINTQNIWSKKRCRKSHEVMKTNFSKS